MFLEDFLENNSLSEQNILAIADINKARWGEYLGKYKIVSPDEIKNLKPDVIIITIVPPLGFKFKGFFCICGVRKYEVGVFIQIVVRQKSRL